MTTYFKILLTIVCGLLAITAYMRYGFMVTAEEKPSDRKGKVAQLIKMFYLVFHSFFHIYIIIALWKFF